MAAEGGSGTGGGTAPGRARPAGGSALAATAALLLALGCGDKKQEEPPPPFTPMRAGDATFEGLRTDVGAALPLHEAAGQTVSSTMIWDRAVVFAEGGAVLIGHSNEETLALRTTARGGAWQMLRSRPEQWNGWGVGAEGALVVAFATRDKPSATPPPSPKAPKKPPTAASGWDRLSLAFPTPDGTQLTPPVPIVGPDAPLKNARIDAPAVIPAVLAADLAAVVVPGAIAYAAPPPQPRPADLPLPSGERFVPVPYGRPPMLVSVQGSDIVVRPWPRPGEKVASGTKVEGAKGDANAWDALAQPPGCEFMGWSFQRLGAGSSLQVVAISPGKSVRFALPAELGKAPAPSQWLGCSDQAVVLEGFDEKAKAPTVVTCTFDGKCVTTRNRPFKIWPEAKEHQLVAVGTPKGSVAVVDIHTNARWGLYVSHSLDGGQSFEQSRTIGEGNVGTGRIQLGALVGLPARTLMLLSGDIAGTPRRGWFLLASDDAGQNWAPP
ncbi:MAG: hypothetical protein HY908_11100 [Myxococcales bacterium]|nr:hypothetical protein [Myxococcales bacterium]